MDGRLIIVRNAIKSRLNLDQNDTELQCFIQINYCRTQYDACLCTETVQNDKIKGQDIKVEIFKGNLISNPVKIAITLKENVLTLIQLHHVPDLHALKIGPRSGKKTN